MDAARRLVKHEMDNDGKESDELLLKMLRDKATAESAFEQLVFRFREQLYWHVRKMLGNHDDSDDVLQTTFIKAWKGLESFRGDSKLKTWLYRIATNEALSYIRSRKRRNHTDIEEVHSELDKHNRALQTVDDGDGIRIKLMNALNKLPEKQRLVFMLKYFDELKYREIAEILGGSTGSLKASYHHAVRKIEAFLKED